MSFKRDLDQNFNQNIIVTVGDNKPAPTPPPFPARPQIIEREKEEEEKPRKSNFWKYLAGIGILGGSAAYIARPDKRDPFVWPEPRRQEETRQQTPRKGRGDGSGLRPTEDSAFRPLPGAQPEVNYGLLHFAPEMGGLAAAGAGAMSGRAVRMVRPTVSRGKARVISAIIAILGGYGGHRGGRAIRDGLIANDRLSYAPDGQLTDEQRAVRGR